MSASEPLPIGFSPCPNDTWMFDALVRVPEFVPGLRPLPWLADIEALYCGWLDPIKIARAYGLDRDVLQRHAERFGWRHERLRSIDLLLCQLAENAMRKLLPTGQATLEHVLAIVDRIQRGQMHLAGAPRRVHRALRTGIHPAPVKRREQTAQTWEAMIREARYEHQ